MMKPKETEALLQENHALLKEHHVKALYLFGSVVRGEDKLGSDVDILVEFQPEARVGLFSLARLQRRLSEILGRPVDLTTPDALHKALKDRIIKEACRIEIGSFAFKTYWMPSALFKNIRKGWNSRPSLRIGKPWMQWSET